MTTARKTRIKVGVIGLGIIGSRVAANLRGAGHQVYVWSRSPHAAPNFLGSVVEVADLCDIIQIFVSDDTALLEVARTIAAALSPRHLIAAHATVSPTAARQAAAIVESQGARYLDAPFTGSKLAAQNKQLNYYVGGTLEALEEARPILETTARKVLHVGGVGDASVLKIATNMLTAATVQTLSESLALVRAAGIDGQRLVEVLEFNGSRSGTSDMKLPAMLAETFDPNFSLKHMLKDVRLALALAEETKIPTPVSSAMEKVFADGIEKQWGDLDFSVVTRNYDAFLPPRPVTPPVDGPAADPAAADSPVVQTEPASDPDPAPAAISPEPARTPGVAPIGGSDLNQPKKSTLRILRDFFNPA